MYREDSEVMKINKYFLENKKSFNKEIGETIRKIRNEKKLSVDSISERSLITPIYATQIEKGKYGISLLKFVCLCNSLEITPNELLEIFLYGCKTNDDILYNKLQEEKDISKNILKYMKDKK